MVERHTIEHNSPEFHAMMAEVDRLMDFTRTVADNMPAYPPVPDEKWAEMADFDIVTLSFAVAYAGSIATFGKFLQYRGLTEDYSQFVALERA